MEILKECYDMAKYEYMRNQIRLKFGIDINNFVDKTPDGRNKTDDAYSIVKYDLDQVLKGIEIEFEHTKNVFMALSITLDHLDEDSYYYTKLTNAGL